MSAQKKKAQQLARQYFQLSLADGVVSPERVSAVLQYIETHAPANAVQVLQAYRRLVATELAKSEAVVEHAGSVSQATLDAIGAQMSQRYNRRISTSTKANPALIAGLRVHVGDDVFEASVAARLQALSAAC